LLWKKIIEEKYYKIKTDTETDLPQMLQQKVHNSLTSGGGRKGAKEREKDEG